MASVHTVAIQMPIPCVVPNGSPLSGYIVPISGPFRRNNVCVNCKSAYIVFLRNNVSNICYGVQDIGNYCISADLPRRSKAMQGLDLLSMLLSVPIGNRSANFVLDW